MIYQYKGKTITAESIKEACSKFGITLAEFRKNGSQIRYTLAENPEPALPEGNGYKERLNEWDNVRKNRTADKNQNAKRIVEELKANPCAICGYDGVSRSKVFHHVEPSTKSFEIRVGRMKQKYLQEEVGKCLLLCLNCHAEVHEIMEGDYEDRVGMMKKFLRSREKNEKCSN